MPLIVVILPKTKKFQQVFVVGIIRQTVPPVDSHLGGICMSLHKGKRSHTRTQPRLHPWLHLLLRAHLRLRGLGNSTQVLAADN
nr:unnamed protein product [Callosobruchus chinensis]